MVPNRVIVFSGHTIYMEGVVNRLRQLPHSGEFHFIDAQYGDYIRKVTELQPSVVIIDAAAEGDSQSCLLCDLLNAFSALTIIRLKVQEKDVQVITSSPHALENAQDLIDLTGTGTKIERR